MRLYKQELKRLFLARSTKIIFILAITMSILLALMASGFNDANVPDEEGNIIPLHGREAISFLKAASSPSTGEVTIDSLKDALQTYQELHAKYCTDSSSDTDYLSSSEFPLDVYWEQVYPITPLLRIITQTYSTNEGQVDLLSLTPADLDNFYEDCEWRLEYAMKSDDMLNNPEYISKAKSLYNNVDKPFTVSHGYTRDAFDYISITILLLVLFSAVMVAPVFSERYESGEDSIIRCTEFGRGKLVRTTLMAVLTVASLMYLIGIGAHLLVSDIIFGVDTLKESVQVLYTIYSLPSLNLLELQIVLALTGWVCCIAVTVLSTCISAIVQETSTAMVVSIIMVFMPTFIYMSIGSVNWLLALIPSASVGLSNNMLYSLLDLRFLNIGGIVFWYPMVLVISAIIETVIFGIIARFAYIRHQVR